MVALSRNIVLLSALIWIYHVVVMQSQLSHVGVSLFSERFFTQRMNV